MNNGHVHHSHQHTNGYRIRPAEDQEEVEDPYANISDYYRSHIAAKNERMALFEITISSKLSQVSACTSSSTNEAESMTIEDPEVNDEYYGDPVRLEDLEPFIKPSLRDDTPLANILHPDLDGIDPR